MPESGSQSRYKRDSRHCHHCFERCARRQRDRLRVLATSDPDLDWSAPMSNRCRCFAREDRGASRLDGVTDIVLRARDMKVTESG